MIFAAEKWLKRNKSYLWCTLLHGLLWREFLQVDRNCCNSVANDLSAISFPKSSSPPPNSTLATDLAMDGNDRIDKSRVIESGFLKEELAPPLNFLGFDEFAGWSFCWALLFMEGSFRSRLTSAWDRTPLLNLFEIFPPPPFPSSRWLPWPNSNVYELSLSWLRLANDASSSSLDFSKERWRLLNSVVNEIVSQRHTS